MSRRNGWWRWGKPRHKPMDTIRDIKGRLRTWEGHIRALAHNEGVTRTQMKARYTSPLTDSRAQRGD